MKNYRLKSKLLGLVAVFALTELAVAQTGPAIDWQKSYGGSATEVKEGGKEPGPNTVQYTTDGGYILFGTSNSNDGDVSGNKGQRDIWVVKVSGSGALQWQKSLGGSQDDRGYSVKQTSDGGYIIAGTTRSNDGDVTGYKNWEDYWVVKLDSNGVIQWQKTYGGSKDDEARSIIQTTDGGYIVAGFSNSTDGDVTGNKGGFDHWIVKLDPAGVIQWQKNFGGGQDDRAYAIQQTKDGGYVVAGTARSTDGDVTGYKDWEDFWVVKLDGSGTLQWQKTLGGAKDDIARSIVQTADGSYIVAGYSNSTDGDITNNKGGFDHWVVKLNNSGTLVWQKNFGGSQDDRGYSLEKISDGNFILAGNARSNDGDVTGFRNWEDFWVVKFDNSGSLLWQKAMGGAQDDSAHSIAQTPDGYIISGYTNSTDGDITMNHGDFDLWVVKLKDASLGTQDIQGAKIALSPNPVKDMLNISNFDQVKSISVYSQTGQLVKEAGKNVSQMSFATFPAGVYLVKITTSDNTTKTYKVIKN